jgi:hypothetical protein
VTAPEAVSTLLDHAKSCYQQVLSTQAVVRGKAQYVFAAAIFAVGTITLFGILLQRALPPMSPGMLVLALAPPVLLASHLLRAMGCSLIAITRETTCPVSLRDVVAAIGAPAGEYDSSNAKRRLALQLSTAAAQTSQSLAEGQTQVLLAEKCLRWSLLLSPLLVAECLFLALAVGWPGAPGGFEPALAATGTTRETLGAVESRVELIDAQLAALEKLALDERLRAAERRVADGSSRTKDLGDEVQSLRTDVGMIAENVSTDRDGLGAEVREFSDRVKRLEERLYAQSRLIQALTTNIRLTTKPSRTGK